VQASLPRCRRGALACCLLLICGPAVWAVDPEPPYKTRYRVINIHRHCGPVTEEAIQAEIEVLDRAGVAAVVMLDASGPDGNLPAWLKLREKHPERLAVFMKLRCDGIKKATFFDDLVRDLERGAKMGLQGVKVWKDLGMTYRDGAGKLLKADDPRFAPFFDKCGALGLPVLIHAADPKEYWYPLTYNSFHYGRPEKDQHYNNPEMPKWEELIRQRDALLKRHPKTKFVGAHFGSLSFDLKQLGETLDKYPNFSVDCSARLRIVGRLNPPAVRDFFVKYQDRILFGTDNVTYFKHRKPSGSANISVYPCDDPNLVWLDPKDTTAVKRWQDRAARVYCEHFQYFETDRADLEDPIRSGGAWLRIHGVKLPPEVLEKFYHANAEKLLPALVPRKKAEGKR
jgi:predicted TIM-barrel fold metal-dependent hydrolase